MLNPVRFWFAILVAVMLNSAGADVYRSVGDDGTIYYTSTPPEKKKTQGSGSKNKSYSSPDLSPYKSFSSSFDKPVNTSNVVMYSASWCGYCRQARNYFRKQKIQFREYDVEKSVKGKKDYRKLRGRGVPIILVGSRRMDGFSVNGFKNIYR